MNSKELKEHLKTLVEMDAASGFEDTVQDYLRDEWADLVNDFDNDGLGSLFGIKHGNGQDPRKRIMLSAHVDEIGLVVRRIREGYLQVASIRGMDSRLMLAKPVLIHTRTRALKGIVAAVPPHIANATGGRHRYVSFDDQWIDLGLPAEIVDELVEVGDMVTMEAPMLDLQGDIVAGKVMDDRASVAAVTACLHHLQTRQHSWDVYATATAQEETGVKGATTAAYGIKPDLAIALDVTFAKQPGLSGNNYPGLAEGPTVGIGANFHDGLVKGLHAAAKRLEMKLFEQPIPGASGTDARAIQLSHAGVPTVLLGIPIRNMHSPVETLSIKDIDRAGRLMAEFISGLAEDYLDTIQWKPDDEDNHDNGDNDLDE
jgi:endoglucanase